MSTIEDRLRDAFRADAATVTPESIRSVPHRAASSTPATRSTPATHSRRASRSIRVALRAKPRWKQLVIPLTAAAAVTVIVVTASVTLPRILSGHRSGPPPSGSLAAGYPGGRLPAGPPPRFFVGIRSLAYTRSEPHRTQLDVYNSATGHIVGHLAPPGSGRYFQTVAALGSSRTFVVAAALGSADPGRNASASDCVTWLYEFRLTSEGQPTGLAPLAVPQVPGTLLPAGTLLSNDGLAASADGSTVAFATYKCDQAGQGQVGVIRLATRELTTWPTPISWPTPTDLSLSADGSLLGMISAADVHVLNTVGAAWVLRTSSAPGPLAERYRRVVMVTAPLGVEGAALSPTGAVMFAVTQNGNPGSPQFYLTIRAYDTTTGHLIRRVAVKRDQPSLYNALFADRSGSYGLVLHRSPLVLNLTTGQLRTLPASHGGSLYDLAW